MAGFQMKILSMCILHVITKLIGPEVVASPPGTLFLRMTYYIHSSTYRNLGIFFVCYEWCVVWSINYGSSILLYSYITIILPAII